MLYLLPRTIIQITNDNSIFRKEGIPVWELIAVRMVYTYKHKRDPFYSKSCLSSQLKTWAWSMFLWMYSLMLRCFLSSVRHFFVVSPFEQICLTRRAALLNIHQLQCIGNSFKEKIQDVHFSKELHFASEKNADLLFERSN